MLQVSVLAEKPRVQQVCFFHTLRRGMDFCISGVVLKIFNRKCLKAFIRKTWADVIHPSEH